MTDIRGSIFNEEAYKLSKMLDHSSWQKGDQVLPRRITPSDIDMGFLPPDGAGFNLDNNGNIIFGELTRGFANWLNVRYGQRRFYESCIGHSQHCAALCQHNISIMDNRNIDTRSDIVAFQIMIFDFGIVVTKPFVGNENWQRFVFQWFQDPVQLRRYLLGRAVGMIKPTLKA
jgi:hypothetical protein